jgi:hypothetical protein
MKFVLLLSALAASAYAQYWVGIILASTSPRHTANPLEELRAAQSNLPVRRLPLQWRSLYGQAVSTGRYIPWFSLV